MKQKTITGLVMVLLPALVLIFLPFFIRSPKVSFSETQAVTSSTFPVIILSTMVLCGVITLLEALVGKKRQEKSIRNRGWLYMAELASLSLAYALSMPTLGYFVSTITVLFFAFWVFDGVRLSSREALRCLVRTAAVAFILYAVFVLLLRVPLPRGLLL